MHLLPCAPAADSAEPVLRPCELQIPTRLDELHKPRFEAHGPGRQAAQPRPLVTPVAAHPSK
eukprot:3801682-Alexandrium_andersonii.AAC.1